MRVINRASKTPPAPVPDPSVAEIAAGVSIALDHQLAERELANLRRQRNALAEEIRAMIGARPGIDGEGQSRANRQIAAKGREREALEKRIAIVPRGDAVARGPGKACSGSFERATENCGCSAIAWCFRGASCC